MKFVIILLITSLLGCSRSSSKPNNQFKVESVSFYEKKLLDETYQWNGPASQQNRIPKLHAARALAYIGDEAVPVLLRSIKDERIDILSIHDALFEIGIPVYEYSDEIFSRKNEGLAKWWSENQLKTIKSRSKYRLEIGLPAI